jgi:3-oxoacyl-[acyl-carrier protein] reductase
MGLVPGGAVVTGGSRGIGAAVATALGRAGAPVVVHYHASSESARQVVAGIEEAGGRAVAIQADLGREEDVARLAESALAELGEIGIFVSNAVLPFAPQPFLQLAWDDLQREIDVLSRAFVRLSQSFLPGMFERRSGRVIAIGSTIVQQVVPGAYAYAVAKGGLAALIRVLAVEAGPHGVTVNTVVPGYTYTDRAAVLSPESRERYAGRAPLGRLGRPEDAAGAVLYLASEEAGYVTGTELVVDGGHVIA